MQECKKLKKREAKKRIAKSAGQHIHKYNKHKDGRKENDKKKHKAKINLPSPTGDRFGPASGKRKPVKKIKNKGCTVRALPRWSPTRVLDTPMAA